jgi:hypothetical protein
MAGSAPQNSRMRRRRRITKSSRRAEVSTMSPPPNTIAYKGPVRTVSDDETTVTLFDSFDVSTAAGTSFVLKFDNNPSSARNWTEYSTSWNNYRVLGIRYRYFPASVVNTTSLVGNFGYQSIVHGTVASPASLPQAASTGIAAPWVPFQRFNRVWKMQEVAEATFGLCSAPASTSNTLVAFMSAGAAVDYGTIMIEYLVQFKTHTL